MEVHRCRFVDYIPSAINALSFAPSTTRPLMACGRANGDIEIWSPKNEWTMEKVIPGGKNTSVEALTWSHQTILTEDDDFWDNEQEKQRAKKHLERASPRLFSAGLNAVITEWDLTTLKPMRAVDSHGGAVWCLEVNHDNTILAAGCEDGCVRLFNIADGALEFDRSFDMQKTRILSLAWSQDDKIIVTGSANSSIYKWNVEQGRVISRMTVDRIAGEDTLVWSVKYLANGTIVSGDSLGHVKFWDAKSTTMLQSFNAHGADVLCLAAGGKNGNTVFSSGVDRKCNQFKLVEQPLPKKTGKNQVNGVTPTKGGKQETLEKWVLSGSRRFHSHDVRALALDESRNVDALVSGGVDVSMVVCPAAEFPNTNQRRLTFVPQRPIISVSKSKRLLLCRQDHGIKLWRLGKSAAPVQPFGELEIGAHLDLIEPQQAILEMNLNDQHNLTAGAISEDGHWIAVADIEQVKLFRVEENPKNPGQLVVKKQKSFPGVRGTGAHFLVFTPDSARLVVASTDSQVVVLDIAQWESGRFDTLCTFGQHRRALHSKKDNNHMEIDGEGQEVEMVESIISMSVSADGLWLATGDVKNRIFVFNLDTLQHHATLPKFDAPLTALHFHPYSPTLVVPTANNVFYLYNVETRRLTDWSREFSSEKQFPTKFLQLKDKIQGVAFNPARRNTMTVWGANYMCQVNLEQGVGDRNAVLNVGKRKRLDRVKDEQRRLQRERRMKKYADLGIVPMPELESGKTVVVLEGKRGRKVLTATTDNSSSTLSSSLSANGSIAKKTLDGLSQSMASATDGEEGNFQVLFKFQPLMFLDFVGDNSLVVVELPFVKVLSSLPPSFYRASYGT